MTFDADDLTAWALSAVIGVAALFAMASAAARGALGWKRVTAITSAASLLMVIVGSAIVLASGDYHLPHAANSAAGFVISLLVLLLPLLTVWLTIAVVGAAILKLRSNRVLRVNGSPS
jgi:hypothetical protein